MKNLLFVLFACISTCVQAQCDSATYTEPQFAVSVQNPACPVVGQIQVTSASGGTMPYVYTLKPNNISNTTGIFSNLAPGTYLVQMKDGCGTIRTRQATITPYNFSTSSTMNYLGCKDFEFTVSCSANGPNLEYGYAFNGSTNIIWGSSPTISLQIAGQATVDLYVKDGCGNIAVSHQFIPREILGYIKELQESIRCFGQEIYPVYYGFEAPTVCLYTHPQGKLVECKQAPSGAYNGGLETNFFNLPFGQNYYVIVEDKCFRDSAFFKDKTSMGGSELNPFKWKCNTFDMHADGNNYDTVCLWNATTNTLVGCKPWTDTSINPRSGLPWPSGGAEWYDLPYGSYYAYIYDPCMDTLIRIDSTVRYPAKSYSRSAPYCIMGQSAVDAFYSPEAPQPWKTYVYWPNDSLAGVFLSTPTSWLHPYPTYPYPGTTKVITEDACGKRDTSYLIQTPVLPTRRLEVKGGCPGTSGQSGGGDIVLHGNGAAYSTFGSSGLGTVTLIKKDSLNVQISQNYTQFNSVTGEQDYFFTNLPTGTYILESSLGCLHYKVYDTIAIKPYVYPLQEQPHILQCGINPYVFRDSVTGGVAPFTYEILSTIPNITSLLTGPQSSNVFSIPPGTSISTITINVTDACGNSHVKPFPVNRSSICDPLGVDSFITSRVLQEKSIKIYPNPSAKQFEIAISRRKKTDYEISICSISGIKIFRKVFKGIDTKTIMVGEKFFPGTYIIAITDLNANTISHYKQIIR